MLAIKSKRKKIGVYFVSLKRRGVMKVKTKLKTYEVNNSIE